MPVHPLLVRSFVVEDDTDVLLLPLADTAPRVLVSAVGDTDEWDDTDKDMIAQGPIVTAPAMFEDTGVVIVDRPAEPMRSDRFMVTFREPNKLPPPLLNFAECSRVEFPDEPPTEPFDFELSPVHQARDVDDVAVPKERASTSGEWPPAPRAPAAPQIRERAFKRAGVYKVVVRPDTNN